MNRRNNLISKAFLAFFWLGCSAGCSNASDHSHDAHHAEGANSSTTAMCEAAEPLPSLGLVTSLPLLWPLDAEIADFASGGVNAPWQAGALSSCFSILPLDTLSVPDESTAAADPLEGLDRLAIIQPRALTPSDNVALDQWVRSGGEALILVDPLLTGHYDLALGDPRRPMDTSLVAIPPVVARWGLEVVFDEPATIEEGTSTVDLGGTPLTIEVASQWNIVDPDAAQCELSAVDYIARCKVGEGRVTLLGDAALFEYRELAGENFETMTALFGYAFDQTP